MLNGLTYADLDALLGQLGFIRVSTTGTQRVFENTNWNAIVILPPTRADEPVRPHHLVTVRKTVVEKGIVEEDAFERLVAERLVAQA